jgi:hypothetical protein
MPKPLVALGGGLHAGGNDAGRKVPCHSAPSVSMIVVLPASVNRTTNVSLPSPPVSTSPTPAVLARPWITSSPAPPSTMSSPPPTKIRSLPSPPLIVSFRAAWLLVTM